MSNQDAFSEDEVRKILKRAAQLQGVTPVGDEPSLSKDDLQEIAKETGIGSAYLTAAINESVHGITVQEDEIFHFWGDAMLLEDNVILDGEIAEEDWNTLENVINRSFGTIGRLVKTGDVATWTVRDDIKMTQVRISSSKGKTRIESLMKMTSYVVGAQLLTTIAAPFLFLFLFGILEIIDLTPVVGFSGLFLSAILGFFASRQLFKSFTKNKKKKITRTTQAVAKLLAQSPQHIDRENQKEVSDSTRSSVESKKRISLDEIPDNSGTESSLPSGTRTHS